MPKELEQGTETQQDDVWFCERCDRNGRVHVEPGEGAYATVQRIEAEHRRKSPQCLSGTTDLRILRLEKD